MTARLEKPIVRFAPSPTGPLHVGGIRTALFNYLFAKKNGGKLILRIEDTDKERSKKEYEDDIIESFKWLGIPFDETFKQSDRNDIHKQYLEKLLESGKVYVSKEEPKKADERNEVIRFKNPNKKITFHDLIKGDITFDTTELKDFVVAKSLNEPIFHLAVVLDDFLMNITHVIRGEDHISNTPRQILILEALGAKIPSYAHLPLILAPDRSKLSKRKHGESVSTKYYRDKGYLPEALLNFLVLVGWNPGNDLELMTLDQMIEKFDLSSVQKSGAIFDKTKLEWMNKEYLKIRLEKGLLSPKDILPNELSKNLNDSQIETLFKTLFERIHRSNELKEQFENGEYRYLLENPEYKKDNLLWKKEPDVTKTKSRLESVYKILENLPEEKFFKENIKNSIWDFATNEGRGEVLWPLRFSLSGKSESPDPFTLCEILGKKETLSRIKIACQKLS